MRKRRRRVSPHVRPSLDHPWLMMSRRFTQASVMPRRSPAPACFMVRVFFYVLLGWSGEINWTVLRALKRSFGSLSLLVKLAIWAVELHGSAAGLTRRPARPVESQLSRPDRRRGLAPHDDAWDYLPLIVTRLHLPAGERVTQWPGPNQTVAPEADTKLVQVSWRRESFHCQLLQYCFHSCSTSFDGHRLFQPVCWPWSLQGPLWDILPSGIFLQHNFTQETDDNQAIDGHSGS